MANRIQLQDALQKNYNRVLFAKEVLNPVFGSSFNLFAKPSEAVEKPCLSELKTIDKVFIYGLISLGDGTQINCYEIILQHCVRIEHSKVAIQRYVRKLLTSGQAAIVNFVSPTYPSTWRFTLIAKDSVITSNGVQEKTTHPKRYTFLLGSAESCKTAAERFEILSIEKEINFDTLVKAFSVERLSKTFFDEYKIHYDRFINYILQSNFRISAFSNDQKAIRDYSKKLLGRLVFLYFVQKKGWMGASDIKYIDGDPDFLMNLFKTSGADESFYYRWLTQLFFETLNTKRADDNFTLPTGKIVKIPYLNGGLFDKEDYDNPIYVFNPILFHNPENYEDPKYRGFFDFLGAFNFTVYEDSPDENTIAVDPEMLGHIFENLLEDNKDKGAFYTPKEVVHFMCQESLTEYLATHLSKEFTVYKQLGNNQLKIFGNQEHIGQLSLIEELGNKALNHEHVEMIVMEKDIKGLTHQQLKKIDSLLDSAKICDLAIGSGAFPMGLLQEIFSIKELIAYELEEKWESAKVKENIIQNSIYGVDIEKGAVDIARLRFWLSLVVDENRPQPLPNLDYKIVVGDSLVSKFENDVIEIDWSIDTMKDGFFGQELLQNKIDLLKNISGKQKQYFHPENNNKKALSSEIKNLKIDLLINQFELMITTKGLDTMPDEQGKKVKEKIDLYIKTQGWKQTITKLQRIKKHTVEKFNHFDWKLDFPEVLNPFLAMDNAGFDIVIGNPPYIQIQKLGEYANTLEKAGFETFIRTGDIYGLFYELGTKLLKDNGVLTFITSNKWMRAGYGITLRKFFTEKANPLKLVDFGGFQVFETATVDTNILMLQKSMNQHRTETCVLNKNYDRRTNLSVYFRLNQTISNNFSAESGWVVLTDIENKIKTKIEHLGVQLKYWDIQINYGIKTGLNEAFIIDGNTKDRLIKISPKNAEIIRPLLRGRDIKKYYPESSDLWLIFTRRGIDIQTYPSIEEHLKQFYEDLKPRQLGELKGRKPGNYKWYEIQDAVDYYQDFNKPKIIYPNMTKYMPFVYDKGSFFTNQKCFIITGNFLGYLTAFLNSNLFKIAFRDSFPELQGGTRELSKIFFDNIYVRQVDIETDNLFLKLILEIQEFKRKKVDTTNLEMQLERLICKLYCLDENEIEIVLSYSIS